MGLGLVSSPCSLPPSNWGVLRQETSVQESGSGDWEGRKWWDGFWTNAKPVLDIGLKLVLGQELGYGLKQVRARIRAGMSQELELELELLLE